MRKISFSDRWWMDKILDYMVQHNSRFDHIDDFSKSEYDYYDVTIPKSMFKELFNLSDNELTKYFQIFKSKSTLESIFISIRGDRCWIMDAGIQYYYEGGFLKEQLKDVATKLIKALELLIKIVGIINFVKFILFLLLLFMIAL